MKTEISHLVIKDDGMIPCQAVLSDGSSHATCLDAGRYEVEGIFEQEGRRLFLRLRDTYGGLKIVEERELARRGRGLVRRFRRRQIGQAAPPSAAAQPVRSAPAGNVRSITAANRDEARKRLRGSIPESLPECCLGRYVECGSVDSWSVFYSIERRSGEWIIRCEGPDGERETSGFAQVEALVDDACERGYDPGDLLSDLRATGRPYLIILAGEIEEILRREEAIG